MSKTIEALMNPENIERAVKESNDMQRMVVLVAELHRLAGKLAGLGHADERITKNLPMYDRWVKELYEPEK